MPPTIIDWRKSLAKTSPNFLGRWKSNAVPLTETTSPVGVVSLLSVANNRLFNQSICSSIDCAGSPVKLK